MKLKREKNPEMMKVDREVKNKNGGGLLINEKNYCNCKKSQCL